MDELELFLIEEIEGKKESTFIYQLHEQNIFNEKTLNNLIDKSYKYFDISDKNRDEYIFIIKGLFKIFLHLFFLLYCNNSPNDTYKIKNYSKVLDEDKVSEIYFQIREIILKIK